MVGLHHQETRPNAIDGLIVAHPRPAYRLENRLANVGMVQHMDITGRAVKAAELLNADALESPAVHYLLGPRNYSQQEAPAAIGQAHRPAGAALRALLIQGR